MASLQSFVHADTWPWSRRVVEEHPELLSEAVEPLFDRLIDEARLQDLENAVPYLEQHRAVLRRCREVGVEAAFAEVSRVTVPPSTRAAPPLRLLARRVMGGMYSREEAIAALVAPPVLAELNEEALLALDEELQGRLDDWQRVEESRVLAELNYSAVQALPVSSLLQARSTATLADVLGRTAPVAEEEAALLDRRVALYRQSIAAWERLGDAKQLRQAWEKLGEALLERYEWHRRPEGLDEAIAAYENGSACGGGQPGLGNALVRRFDEREDPADLERAVAVLEEAVELAVAEPERARVRLYLAEALLRREHGDPLGEFIAVLEQAIFPPGSASWASVQLDLAWAFCSRAEEQGQAGDLERSIHCYTAILRLLPTEAAPDAVWSAAFGLVERLRHCSPVNWEQLAEAAARARVAAGYFFLETMPEDMLVGYPFDLYRPVPSPSALRIVVEAQTEALTQIGQEGAAAEAVESAHLRAQAERDLGEHPLDRVADPAWREAIAAAWRRVRRARGEYTRTDEARLQWAIARLAEARRDYYYLCQNLFPQLTLPDRGADR